MFSKAPALIIIVVTKAGRMGVTCNVLGKCLAMSSLTLQSTGGQTLMQIQNTQIHCNQRKTSTNTNVYELPHTAMHHLVAQMHQLEGDW